MEPSTKTSHLSNPQYDLYWEGIIYYPEIDEGEPSLRKFLEGLRQSTNDNEILEHINGLRGSWTLFIHDHGQKRWMAFSDHSHQCSLFFSDTSVSNSFLRLRAEVHDKTNADEEALLCFLYSGYCYTKSIFYSGISKLDYHDYIEIKESISVRSKRLPDVFAGKITPGSFVSTLRSHFSSLRGHKMCLDLSGGTDTRALLISLHHLGFDFDVATYGDHDYSEVQIARKTADLIGKDLQYIDLTPKDMHLEDILLAWKGCDGLDIALDSFKFETWRSKLGYTVVVGGTAGELYKDGGWYVAAIRNGLALKGHAGLIQHLFNTTQMLWAGLSTPELELLFNETSIKKINDFISELSLTLLRDYTKYPLLEASDRIFFDFSVNRPGGTINDVICRILPLYEPEMIHIGVHQSIWKRLNHNLYRQECGTLNRAVAKIETDRLGLTLSPSYIDILLEYGKYVSAYLHVKRQYKMGHGHGLPTSKSPNQNKKITADYVLGHPDLQKGIKNLRDRGFLRDNLNISLLNARMAGRIIAIHYLLES